MSDLFCAATLVVARHAEAEYESDLTSDSGGSLTLAGREQSKALATSLLDRRVAAILCSDMARAVQTAEIAAALLEVPVLVRRGLREFSVGDFAGKPYTEDLFADVMSAWAASDLSDGCPGGETGSDVVRRMGEELESVCDLHRGETVLVVSHSGSMRLTLPRLASNVTMDFAVGKPIDYVGTCELAVDADGCVLRSWNSRSLDAVVGG